ncbi:MAG TPA: amidohydrolase family protein [Casimicrobiaceae bacterium]|nr:amidohydrolase family protein [Casimicrobiaceae bacterium]
MDLVLRNATIAYDGGTPARFDIGFSAGAIARMAPRIESSAPKIDLDGRFVVPGFVETHIHLDKSAILDRCTLARGTLDEAIAEVRKAKAAFTEEDVFERASRTLEKSIVNGTTRIRTHVEVDPGIGLRGFHAIKRLADAYRWAVDIEICVFPQEGLINWPGTEELLREALRNGARLIGAAPYTDTDPHAQIDRVFAMAHDFDVDIDMHLDLGDTPERMDVEYVCELTERTGWGGRVAVGHVTKLSMLEPERLDAIARRLRDAGVAVTVLPSTDLYLMGRQHLHSAMRGVTRAHELLHRGVNCSLSTNNVLNPFTPFGDCSLVRMANLYANIGHVGNVHDVRECLAMVTSRSARLMRIPDYGLATGMPADAVVLDCETAEQAVAEIAMPLYGFKRGRMTFSRAPPQLHRP